MKASQVIHVKVYFKAYKGDIYQTLNAYEVKAALETLLHNEQASVTITRNEIVEELERPDGTKEVTVSV